MTTYQLIDEIHQTGYPSDKARDDEHKGCALLVIDFGYHQLIITYRLFCFYFLNVSKVRYLADPLAYKNTRQTAKCRGALTLRGKGCPLVVLRLTLPAYMIVSDGCSEVIGT